MIDGQTAYDRGRVRAVRSVTLLPVLRRKVFTRFWATGFKWIGVRRSIIFS